MSALKVDYKVGRQDSVDHTTTPTSSRHSPPTFRYEAVSVSCGEGPARSAPGNVTGAESAFVLTSAFGEMRRCTLTMLVVAPRTSREELAVRPPYLLPAPYVHHKDPYPRHICKTGAHFIRRFP